MSLVSAIKKANNSKYIAQLMVQFVDLPLVATQQMANPVGWEDTTKEFLELLKHAQCKRSFIVKKQRTLTLILILLFYRS